LLDRLPESHHRQMDSVHTTREQTILAAMVVLVHTAVMLVHGAAHMRLNIELPAWANFYVLGIVGIGPIAGLFLLWSRRQRTGATILFTTMIGALLFGLWKHFMTPGADHVMHLQAGLWRLPFQITAVLLAVSEAAGAAAALMLLYALPSVRRQ